MRFNICKIEPINYLHSSSFDDLSKLLCFGIIDSGYKCTLSSNKLDSNCINIVIGTHLLSQKDIVYLNNSVNRKEIIYINTEQLKFTNNQWLSTISSIANQNKVLWDYSKSNINYLKNRNPNVKALFLKIGYHKILNKIENKNYKDKCIDFLFYGSINQRRLIILEKLTSYGINLKHVFGVYGSELDKLISDSKFILNLHYYESKILESIRLFYLITNKVPILTEISDSTVDDQDFKSFTYYAEYENLLDKCIELLNYDYSLIMDETLIKNKKFKTRSQSKIMSNIINETMRIFDSIS